MEPAQAAEASANVRGGKAEARSPSGYVGEVELQAHRAETRERIVAIRDLMARYADLNLRRVSWSRELEGRLPNDEADRESLTRLDAAKRRLLGLSASRRDAEHKLVALRGAELVLDNFSFPSCCSCEYSPARLL